MSRGGGGRPAKKAPARRERRAGARYVSRTSWRADPRRSQSKPPGELKYLAQMLFITRENGKGFPAEGGGGGCLHGEEALPQE